MKEIQVFFRSMAYVGGLMAYAEFSHEAHEKLGFVGLWFMGGIVILLSLVILFEDIFRK